MEKVLPEPVTPSSVWCARPDWMPSMSAAIAAGWSPAGTVVRLQLEWSRFAHACPELQRKMPSRTLAEFKANRYSP